MLHSDESGAQGETPFTATTGVDVLDRALNGLFWGDNVVFAADDAADVEPFFRAVAAKAALYEASAFVTIVREPAELEQAYPGLEVIDAREDGPLALPRPLLDAIAARCAGSPRQLLLFDSLAAMSDRWGQETAGRFFSRGCPLLLGLGAIAYWSLPAAGHTPTLRREIEGITQCVLDVGDGRLRIAKAEGRPPGPCRFSTPPARACGPISCVSHRARRRRPGSHTRASSSSRSRRGSSRCRRPPGGPFSVRVKR